MKFPANPSANQGGSAFWRGLALVCLLSQQTASLCYGAGAVVAWGADDAGQIDVPAGITNAAAVAGGASHSLALQANGTVVAWGFNLSGQTSVPPGLTTTTMVGGGETYSMALKSDGKVLVWGQMAPPPASLSNVTAIAAGASHALALKSDGTVVSWGSQTSVPAGLGNVLAVAAGNGHSLAVTADGLVTAWGNNSDGQTNVPPGLSNVIAVAAGSFHSLALQRNGKVVAWGRNNSFQTNVPGSLTAVAISAGAAHSLALKPDGTLAAWGDDTYGQIDVGTNSGYVAIAAGGYHNLAIQGDGSPFILLQPLSQTVLISKSATFQVIATGNQPLTYQWQHNGQPMTGFTNATLLLSNVQTNDAGAYNVVVGNVFGSVLSATATLTAIGGPPGVAIPPPDQTVICGDTATLRVSAGGSTPLSYQWFFQGNPLAGATGTALTITNVTPAVGGSYSVTITNLFGSVSTGAVLTVTVQPPTITSALTASAVQGQNFTYTIRALHTPLSFQVRYLPAGLTLNTNTGVISGIPAENGTFGPQITAINACTSDTETLVLTIAPTLPRITSPTFVTGTEGSPLNYRITATASPIWYGAQNLPVGLSVGLSNGIVSGAPTYAGEYDSTLWASNIWGAGFTNVHFSFANAVVTNINVGGVTYNYSKPYLLDFQFSLYTILGDTNNTTNAPIQGLVVDPRLLSFECLEDGVTNSSTETGPFVAAGSAKLIKVYMVLDFTKSITSLSNGDVNGDGISDAVDYMVSGAEDFVNQQPADTRIGVIEFHRDDMAPSNVVSLTTDKVLLKNQIAGIYTNYVRNFSSGSRCWDALSLAITQLGASNVDEQHYVVFVSDGSDQSSTTTFDAVLTAATNANVRIFSLGFGDELDPVPLQTLATTTQGAYFQAGNDPAELGAQFAQISKTARGQYISRWATLRRTGSFMPSFKVFYSGLAADSPTNPYWQDTNNPIIDTNSTPPTTNYNMITNFIIGNYEVTSYAPPPAVTVGSLRFAPNAEVQPTGIDLRATYVPRDIAQMRLHYVPNYPCTVTLQSTGTGQMLSGWTMVQTNDGAGGVWLLLSSPNPSDLNTAIPFAAFGRLLTFSFRDAINTSNAFSGFEIDNTIYTNIGWPSSPSFTFQNTNLVVKQFPILPYGTPAPWLQSYGLPQTAAAELLDSDGDGMANWQEYRANTNPTNAASKLVVRNVTRQFDGRYVVTFSTSINRTYQVQSSVDLINWVIVQDFIPGLNQDLSITDTRFIPDATIYYRVQVY